MLVKVFHDVHLFCCEHHDTGCHKYRPLWRHLPRAFAWNNLQEDRIFPCLHLVVCKLYRCSRGNRTYPYRRTGRTRLLQPRTRRLLSCNHWQESDDCRRFSVDLAFSCNCVLQILRHSKIRSGSLNPFARHSGCFSGKKRSQTHQDLHRNDHNIS